MWTPKRILLVISGMLACLVGYGFYLYFLGDIDSLPPLPREYWPRAGIVPEPGHLQNPDRLWFQAFGPECEEVNRVFKLELQSKGWGISANKFDIEKSDGRVKLTPFSAYLVPKSRKSAKFPEINTVRCDEAYLTMDRPVTKMGDLSNRRIVGIELRSEQFIRIVNNRGTLEKSDDIDLRISNGSLFFDDNKSLVWTNGVVQLKDHGAQPQPTEVRAKGMDLYLSKDMSTSRDSKPAKKSDNSSGVEKLVLRSNVDMHVFLDARSGFLDGTQAAKAAPGKNETSHVVIKTMGPFTYDVLKDIARFECAKMQDAADPLGSEDVLVLRQHILATGEKKHDQLLCNALNLELRKKEQPQGRSASGERGLNKDIAKAHATALPGREVLLMMETQKLEAFGEEMIYWKGTETSGPQTIVRGKPLRAAKDAHKIKAQELHLIGADKDGKGQRAFAKGPGIIELHDRNKDTYPMEALWKDVLTVENDVEKGPDGDRILDLLTFKDSAIFRDKVEGKELRAWRIQIWLQAKPRDQTDSSEAKSELVAGASSQNLHKIDAFKNVSANSPELIIPKADRLVVRFRAEQVEDRFPVTANKPVNVLPISDQPETLPLQQPGNEALTVLPEASKKEADKSQRKPIVLEAREVAAYFVRGARTELQELVTEGSVHVHQDGKSPDDKGVDITGEMLNLLHNTLGDKLFVYGDTRKPAQLQLGELVLIGPKVTINQQNNIAEVDGVGAMTLPSGTAFEGAKPAKTKGGRLTVHWNKNMLFNGQYADFHGGVVAYQDNSKMQCQSLQVTLDKAVSFKEGQKSGQSAKVERILCDRNVFIVDEQKSEKGELVKYVRFEAVELAMNNQDGRTTASGPGTMNNIAPGAANPALAPTPASNANGPDEMKLTRVTYYDQMSSIKKGTARSATFYGNVEVFHVAGTDADVKLVPDKLPKGGFYLRCDVLGVYTKEITEKKVNQRMEAKGKVDFRAEKFYGQSSTVNYDDASEIVVFEGAEGNPVRLFQDVGTPELREIRGSKILYNRRTGGFQVEGGQSIETPNTR